MNYIFIALISICMFVNSYSQTSQEPFDSTDINFSIKAYLYSKLDLGVLSKSDREIYFNSELKLIELKSNCLSGFKIYHVPWQSLIVKKRIGSQIITEMPLETSFEYGKVIVAHYLRSDMIFYLHGPNSRGDLLKFVDFVSKYFSNECFDCKKRKKKKNYECIQIETIDFPQIVKVAKSSD